MRSRGFTLVELVVAITISGIVVVFAAMFIGAPLAAFETQSRRATMVSDAGGAWPRMEADLRAALPNSLRTRRNGNRVVLEMLAVIDVARYKTTPSAPSFTTAGVYRGAALPAYLAVNNLGTPGADAYSLTGSMAQVTTIQILPGAAGENIVNVTPTPLFTADSSRHRIYYVAGPVTYLCDEGQGTLQRFANYTIAANQAARDTAAELNGAGAAGVLVTRGLTACNFDVSPVGSSTQSQTASVRLTTTSKTDSVTLLHSTHAEFVP